MLGKHVGNLTVVAYSHTQKNYGQSSRYWLCSCACGNTTVARTADINRGKVKSCGCMRYIFTSEKLQKSIVGHRFGRLVVLSKSDRQTTCGTYFYRCKCDCGEKKEINGGSLRHGLTKSCGCLKIEMNMKQYENGVSNGYYHQKRLNADNQRGHKAWRKAVYERDGYTCRACGKEAIGGLCAHHITPWSQAPELRTDVKNGITLCRSCHSKIHSLAERQSIVDRIKERGNQNELVGYAV